MATNTNTSSKYDNITSKVLIQSDCIQKLQERIVVIELKRREILQTQEEIKSDEKFTVEIAEVYKDKIPIRGGKWGLFFEGAVCCKICQENCHYPCIVSLGPGNCEVMKDGHCTVCTRKCSVSAHVKEEWRYVNETRKGQKTLQDVGKKSEENKAGSESKLSLLENLEKKMEDLTAEKDQLLEESFQHVVKLEQITLNVDSLSTHVHLDFLIEKMKEKGDAEKVQKLEAMKSRVDERTRAGLQYMFGKLTAAVKQLKKQ